MTEVIVDKLVSNGEGMARLPSGEIVFVPGALPGERWLLEKTEKVRGVQTAVAAERASDAPERVSPACPHADRCGGCGLLHVARDRETGLKASYLADNLRRLAGLPDIEIEPVGFPDQASRMRGKLHTGEHTIGFHETASNAVVAIPECRVIPESVVASLPELARLARASSFSGEIFFATDAEGNRPVFTFRGQATALEELETELAGIAFETPSGEPLGTIGDPWVRFHWNRLRVALSPSAFFQSNPASWPVFWKWVDRFRETFAPTRVWDTHAGAGFLSSRLEGLEILATEPEPASFQALTEALASAEIPARTWCGTAERAMSKKKLAAHTCDGVILDPPREGLSKPLRDWLREQGPRAMLYFSCDIGTFCRDLAALRQTYSPESPVLAMNTNPGTLRLETAVLLGRK